MAESSSCRRCKKSEDEDCDPSRSEKEAAPDKKLTRFAFKLALLEKVASTLGTMNFIWATVVLLGGFSQSLKSIDFWFVSIILVVEGLRISCRSGELATQAATWRSCSPDISLLLIYLYSLLIQELSAFACIVLSAMRIERQQYGSDDNLYRNRALNIFYALSLLESFLTLLGFLVRGCLMYKPIRLAIEKLIPFRDKFNCKEGDKLEGGMLYFSLVVGKVGVSALIKEYGIDESQFDTIWRFLNDTYYRCINGNVFDGLKMDFVSYSLELLRSTDHNDQLMGARLLQTLANKYIFAEETLRAIGTMRDVVERLIEMLNWDKPHEQKIRRAAAEIISKLVEIPRNRIRVMAIPEFMESIPSLLYDRNHIAIQPKQYEGQSSDKYEYSDFSEVGLRILKILANDPDNCAKIGTLGDVVERLIEMLKWEKPHEQEIRRAAADIICKFVEIPRNRIRVMAISESMESITSLLYDRNKIGIHSTEYQGQFPNKYNYKCSDFTVLGLRIFKIFANDPENSGKIGTSKGLLCKIIELNPEASESEILRHLEITPMETLEILARKQDIEDTSGFELCIPVI